ncbi:CstA-like transporter-associated (seleno)protein [Methylolobus aquaticus]
MLNRWIRSVRGASAAAGRVARWLSEDRAYLAYVRHWQAHHAAEGGQPLSRSEFFRQRTQRKWDGINRCC